MRMKRTLRPAAGTIAGLTLGLALAPLITRAQSDEMRNVSRTTVRETQPDNRALSNSSDEQKEIEAIKRQLDEARLKLEAGQPAAIQRTPVSGTTTSGGALGSPLSEASVENDSARTSLPPAVAVPEETTPKAAQTHTNVHRPAVGHARRGSPLQVFAVSHRGGVDESPEGFTVLPAGSHVKARVVSGVEANAREPYPVLLQLDYAFSGPNKTKIDLSNCFMIAKAKANMSTERVMMETESLSCVRDSGEHFKREAKGYVAGSDNTFGATGTYISKQGQVLLAAVLASIAKNAGQAIADAQKTTSIGGFDKAATASNITGNKAAFIGGSALVDGGAMVAQWYLEQAKDLLPSIGVGSGQDVFVVMLDSIAVPPLSQDE